MPILEDLYNELLEQGDPDSRDVAAGLEIYVKGSLSVFNHRTNVDINQRVVCYDIRDLGKQLKKLGMLIVQDQVWNRVTVNRYQQKMTRYYIDEFHLLLREEQTAAYSIEIWKRFRKWGGIPTGITQNVKDLLASREVENIFENSEYICMLNHAAGDREILAQHLGISPYQLRFVTRVGEGQGLIFYGSLIMPFVDHFPKDTKMYQIMTTKLKEVTAEKPKTVSVRKVKADAVRKEEADPAENSKAESVRKTNPKTSSQNSKKATGSGIRKKVVSKKQPVTVANPAESGDKLFVLIGGMIPYEGSMWMGNATELAERLRMTDPSVSLAPMQLSRKLNLMKEKLEDEGIFYESGRNSAGRYVTLTRKLVGNRSRKETGSTKEVAETETARKPKQKPVRKARKKTAGTDIKEKPNAS